MFMKYLSLCILGLVLFSRCNGPRGCTDATAINYNPDAGKLDGSCIYPSDVFAGLYLRKDTNIKKFGAFPDSSLTTTKEDTMIIYYLDNTKVSLRRFSPCVGDTILSKVSKDSLKFIGNYSCQGDWKNFKMSRNNQTVRYSYQIIGLVDTQEVRGIALKVE